MSQDKPFQSRRKNPRPFAMVPTDLARDGRISDKAFRLWIVLQSHADFDGRDCHPWMSTLATECGCSRASIWRAQTELVGLGLLEVESGQESGSGNIYVVIDPVDADPRCRASATGGQSPTRHPSRADETPGVASTRDKRNETQRTRSIDKSENPALSVVDEIPDLEAFEAGVAELRAAMDPSRRQAVG